MQFQIMKSKGRTDIVKNHKEGNTSREKYTKYILIDRSSLHSANKKKSTRIFFQLKN